MPNSVHFASTITISPGIEDANDLEDAPRLSRAGSCPKQALPNPHTFSRTPLFQIPELPVLITVPLHGPWATSVVAGHNEPHLVRS